MKTGGIHIGTSGWQYPHWKEIFYPKGLPVARQLAFYSEQFATTEVNSSFYRLPRQTTVANWIASVSKGFKLCPKISRYITHAKKLNDPEQGVPRFFDVFDPFRKHCGPVLIQLPANVRYAAEKSAAFFSYLRAGYPQWTFSLETRHESWQTPEAVALLKKHKIGWVMIEAGTRWPSSHEIITAQHIYIRLHGPDGSYATGYSNDSIKDLASKCLAWKDRGHQVWIFFNNDIHGHAVRNARQLLSATG